MSMDSAYLLTASQGHEQLRVLLVKGQVCALHGLQHGHGVVAGERRGTAEEDVPPSRSVIKVHEPWSKLRLGAI